MISVVAPGPDSTTTVNSHEGCWVAGIYEYSQHHDGAPCGESASRTAALAFLQMVLLTRQTRMLDAC